MRFACTVTLCEPVKTSVSSAATSSSSQVNATVYGPGGRKAARYGCVVLPFAIVTLATTSGSASTPAASSRSSGVTPLPEKT
jgi:hypothetical protein